MSEFPDDELDDALRQWASDHRIETAAGQRSAARWQQQLATDELSLFTTLEQIAESETTVNITTATATHRGVIDLMGRDFAALSQQGTTTFVALRAVSSVQIEVPWRSVVSGSSGESLRPSLAQTLALLVETRPRARVITIGTTQTRAGELVAIGDDILVLDQNGPPRHTTLIPIDQIAEISFT